MLEQPVDGFLLSASQLYLPISYRANALAQMEVLRLARGYRPRWYMVPEDLEQPVPGYGQLEYQVRVEPGSYVWGLAFTGPIVPETEVIPERWIKVQVTDDCTETPFFSDYVLARALHTSLNSVATQNFDATQRNVARGPVLINPRLIGDPGTLSVELYNANSADIVCQLLLFVAEPMIPPAQIVDELKAMGVVQVQG